MWLLSNLVYTLQGLFVSVIILSFLNELIFRSQRKNFEHRDLFSRHIQEKMSLGKMLSERFQSYYSALYSKNSKEEIGTSNGIL